MFVFQPHDAYKFLSTNNMFFNKKEVWKKCVTHNICW